MPLRAAVEELVAAAAAGMMVTAGFVGGTEVIWMVEAVEAVEARDSVEKSVGLAACSAIEGPSCI